MKRWFGANASQEDHTMAMMDHDLKQPLPMLATTASSSSPCATTTRTLSNDRNPLEASYYDASQRETRFVAGEQFFNYEMYGSLRPGGEVRLLSRNYIGLLVVIITTSISYFALRNIGGVLIPQYLALTPQQTYGLRGVMELPIVLSLFVGILSDCRAFHGFHQKSMLVYGHILMAIGMISCLIVTQNENSVMKTFGLERTTTWIMSLQPFCVGMIMTYTPLLARVIELTQQEQLTTRGKMLAIYMFLRAASRALVQCSAHLPVSDSVFVRLQILFASLLVLSVLPIPFLIKYFDEPVAMTTRVRSIKEQLVMLVRVLQQKAMWQTLTFHFFILFFLPLQIPHWRLAVMHWANLLTPTSNPSLVADLLQMIVPCVTIVAWYRWFLNAPWRKFFAIGAILSIFPPFLAGTLVIFNVVRSPIVYASGALLAGVGIMIRKITFHVPIVELTTRGSEGTIAGLMISLDILLVVFGVTTMNTLQGLSFFDVRDIFQDNTHVRWMVFWTLVVNVGIQTVSFVGIVFLPRQKLDAQLQRIYGGFTSSMGFVIIAIWLVCFLYTVIVSILPFIAAAACSRIAGGPGC